jgi:hypothetical protein
MGARGEGLINDFGGSLSDNRMIVHGSESLRRAGRRRVKYYLVNADEGGCKTYFSTGDGCDAICFIICANAKKTRGYIGRIDLDQMASTLNLLSHHHTAIDTIS